MTEDNKIEEEKRLFYNKSVILNKDWTFKESFPTISAYTTSYNCLKNNYPLFNAIKSFKWVDELIVVDGGSDDGTLEELEKLKEELPHLNVFLIPIDWEAPGKDGIQKSMARAMSTSDFLIQFDADEICLGKPELWKRMAKDMVSDIIELPVLEPFGNICNIRLNKEHNPVKWRLFKNKPEITHGIPKHDQLKKDGKTFSSGASDGCFPISIVSERVYPSRLSAEAREVKELFSSLETKKYSDYLESLLSNELPAVLHLGHVDLTSKIKLFLNEWRKWWADLYNKDPEDISTYFPGKNLKDITDKDINDRAEELIKLTPIVEVSGLMRFESLTNAEKGCNI